MTTLNGTGMETAAAKGKISSTILLMGFPFENINAAIVFSWSKLSSEKTSLTWRIWTKKGRIEVGPCKWSLHTTNWMGSNCGRRRDIFDLQKCALPCKPNGDTFKAIQIRNWLWLWLCFWGTTENSKQTRIKEEAYDLPRNSANFCNRSDALQMTSSHNELRGKQLGTSSTFWMGAPRSNQSPAFQICWNWPLRKLQCQRNKRIAFDFI